MQRREKSPPYNRGRSRSPHRYGGAAVLPPPSASYRSYQGGYGGGNYGGPPGRMPYGAISYGYYPGAGIWDTSDQKGVATGGLHVSPPLAAHGVPLDPKGRTGPPRARSDDSGAPEDEPMMTFRSFVILQTVESAAPEVAMKEYVQYKEEYAKRYAEKFFNSHKNTGLMLERYHPHFLRMEFDEYAQLSQSEATGLFKMLAEERLIGLNYAVPVQNLLPVAGGLPGGPGPCKLKLVDVQAALAALLGKEISVAGPPLCITSDPNLRCLCIRGVPIDISKWDILETVKERQAAEGLIDISVPSELQTGPSQSGGAETGDQSGGATSAGTGGLASHTRTAWIRYATEDACSAAEMKLEKAVTKKIFTLHPIRTTSNEKAYTVFLTPGEASHPARIRRDRLLSARLIRKLDRHSAVSEIYAPGSSNMAANKSGAQAAQAGGSSVGEAGEGNNYSGTADVSMSGPGDTGAAATTTVDADSDTDPKVLKDHPLIGEMSGASGRSDAEQLDLQLLYLRVVHNVCYYSGKKFKSQRELWDAVGPVYLRPQLSDEDIGRLPFDATYGDESSLESLVTLSSDDLQAVADLESRTMSQKQVKQMPKALVSSAPGESAKETVVKKEFTPDDVELLDGNEASGADRSAVTGTTGTGGESAGTKTEEEATMQGEAMKSGGGGGRAQSKRAGKKFKSWDEGGRGQSSLWVKALETRIRDLLEGDWALPQPVSEDSPEVQAEWRKACQEKTVEVEREKWKCLLCTKLFRGAEFVHKHLKNKHSSLLGQIIEKLCESQMLEKYLADPDKLLVLPSPLEYLYRDRRAAERYRRNDPPEVFDGPNNVNTFYLDGPGETALSSRTAAHQHFHSADSRRRMAYHDWDAPKVTPAIGAGNLRSAVQYGDL